MLEDEIQKLKTQMTDGQAEIRKFMNNQSAELSHLALLSRTTAENTASPEMKHAVNGRLPLTGTVAAIAADATRGLTAPTPPPTRSATSWGADLNKVRRRIEEAEPGYGDG